MLRNLRGGLPGKPPRLADAIPAQFELAQVNISRLLAPLNDPLLADFVANLAPVYAAAESAAGFVWRWPDGGAERRLRMFGDRWLVVNISVWDSPALLLAFVYGPAHRPVLSRRLEWFSRLGEQSTVLWWVPAGHRPTVAEAQERLALLRTRGPTAEAFSLRDLFPPPAGRPRAARPTVRMPRDARRHAEEPPVPGVFQRLIGKVTACWYWV